MSRKPSWPPHGCGLPGHHKCDMLGYGKDGGRHPSDGLPFVELDACSDLLSLDMRVVLLGGQGLTVV